MLLHEKLIGFTHLTQLHYSATGVKLMLYDCFNCLLGVVSQVSHILRADHDLPSS
jgi:hypothetical protein